MTRQEEYGVPFIASEYAFLLLEKAFSQPTKESLRKFDDEINWQAKHHGLECAEKILEYIEKNRIDDFPENLRQHVKDFVRHVGFFMSPSFKKYVRDKYFSDMPYPRLF